MIQEKTALTLAAKFAMSDTSRLHLFSLDGKITSAKHGQKLLRELDLAADTGEYRMLTCFAQERAEIEKLQSYVKAHSPAA